MPSSWLNLGFWVLAEIVFIFKTKCFWLPNWLHGHTNLYYIFFVIDHERTWEKGEKFVKQTNHSLTNFIKHLDQQEAGAEDEFFDEDDAVPDEADPEDVVQNWRGADSNLIWFADFISGFLCNFNSRQIFFFSWHLTVDCLRPLEPLRTANSVVAQMTQFASAMMHNDTLYIMQSVSFYLWNVEMWTFWEMMQ